MAKFKIYTPAGASFTTAPVDYVYESEALANLDCEIMEGPANEDGFIAVAKDADAIYAKGMPISKKIIDSLTRCRTITLGSVGVDSVDVAAATAKGIPVTNCPDTFIEEVADHLMMLLLGCFRDVLNQDRLVRDGNWRQGRTPLLEMPRLMGQTLGLIAFGHVARAVARRALPFGLIVKAYDPFIEELVMIEHGVLPATLDEVMGCDFVSMHAPATPEAQGMLTAKQFRKMKKTGFFLNVGRGPTVKEADLIQALEEKWIAGAGLDVLEVEPPRQDNPLLAMKNVIFSAHTASASARFDPARKRRVGQELALALTDRWPMSCVNPTVLPKLDRRRWQPISMERGPNS
ncbi:MAG TPA: C-terminal binding protein [Acetobacteraceae bacterium]|nr:C-terminal binding protein [Acetobacteraceae bacterium]